MYRAMRAQLSLHSLASRSGPDQGTWRLTHRSPRP
ncbi:uncharacterized protein PgNI_04343 [Pyricularia grisea]|uniref:Uncharacterized protein n=1 Tax=Pyricularia grisea TaxID=148305 RepID=A0A6P8BCR0_PYRGI|nr:uncharacterized protein PgNI_04343 [Pyricularia grisea]TLD13605.1 hypothetical protein PgNI_04343 [Pyricularia grisea]